MIDFFKEFRLYLSDKLSNPLTTTFVISWCLWNFQKLIVIFSDEPPSVKLAMIDGLYSKFYFFEIIAPFLSSIFIIIWPYPTIKKEFYKRHREHQIKLKEETIRLDKETPVDPIEYVKLYEKTLLQERKHENELSIKATEIEKLKNIIELKNNEIDEFKIKTDSKNYNSKNIVVDLSGNDDPIISGIVNNGTKKTSDKFVNIDTTSENIDYRLSNNQSKILDKFKENDSVFISIDLINKLDIPNIEREHSLSLLLKEKIIQDKINYLGGLEGYSLTPKGQHIVLSN